MELSGGHRRLGYVNLKIKKCTSTARNSRIFRQYLLLFDLIYLNINLKCSTQKERGNFKKEKTAM